MTAIREQEDALFDEWRAGRPSFNPDGVVNEVAYNEAPVKILLVMKEVNDKTKTNLDLRDFLTQGTRPQTWDNVTRWVEGLNLVACGKRIPSWSSFEDITDERRKRALGQLVVVNLKKSAGKETTNNEKLHAEAKRDVVWLRRQLGLYMPDFTICCGSAVTSNVKRLGLITLGPAKYTGRGVRYFDGGQHGIVIDYCHPAVRITSSIPLFALMDAVKEIKNGRTG